MGQILLCQPFLPPEPGNQWPASAWPNQPNIGAIRGYGNAGGDWPYVDGMPRDWSLYDNGTNAQWDWNFGSHGGEPYFDWDWYDNFNWGSTFCQCGYRLSLSPAALQNQVWEVGFHVAWAPGTNVYPNTLGVGFDEVDSGYGWLQTTETATFTSPATQVPSDPYRPARMSSLLTVQGATTAHIGAMIWFDWGAKTSADRCRLRVYKPFLRRRS